MKKCVDTAELLTDYLEGTLPAEDSRDLQVHLKDCPPCEAFIKSFKTAGELTRNVLIKQIPQDFNTRLSGFLKARCSKEG